MARTVKEPDIRRSEILDAAQQLFTTKGYDQTSVQDIIGQIGIAKGTFYHYFGSKIDLLDELIGRMIDQAMAIIEPIAADSTLDAPAKYWRLFNVIASWKTQSKAFLLDILRPFYAEENAVFRRKTQAAGVARIAPCLTHIIRQGMAEGVFDVDYPDEVAEFVMLILMSLSEGLALMILHDGTDGSLLPAAERKVLVAQRAVERLLGAAPGSLPIMDLASLRPWFE